jgi:hypothetical protein
MFTNHSSVIPEEVYVLQSHTGSEASDDIAPGVRAMLTESEASDYIGGIPVGTLRQWRYLDKSRPKPVGPPYVKLGRHVRYRRSDLDAWLEAHTVEPKGAA